MLKNVCLIVALTWMSYANAKAPVVHETMSDSESFKIDKPVAEQDAQRSVAGERIKKKKAGDVDSFKEETKGDSDSEVRYWRYSE